jgi:hypothetical protein
VNLSISALRDPPSSISVPRPLDDIFRKKVTGTRRDVIPSQVVQVWFKVTFERGVGRLVTTRAKTITLFVSQGQGDLAGTTACNFSHRVSSEWQTQMADSDLDVFAFLARCIDDSRRFWERKGN